MIKVDICPKIIEAAKRLGDEMGELNNSITRGEGNLAGYVGELIYMQHLDEKSQKEGLEPPMLMGHYDYDIIHLGKKIDVKTKRTTVEPKPYYEASIAAYNTRQRCDEYVFLRVDLQKGKAYMCGSMPRDEYFKKARFLKKGTVDGDNNFTVKADCYNLEYKDMNTII